MKKVVIVQARMTSTRLPNKVMLPLGDKTVLGQVLTRCQKIFGVDEICCAIPLGTVHDILVEECHKYGVYLYRGSEMNVLERYYDTAKEVNADIIMRITADCPLIDPKVCERVLQSHIENKAQYSCNNKPPSWPHGLDCEAFGFYELEMSVYNANQPYQKEHVTPWMRENLMVNNISNDKNFYALRWTLDTHEDYDYLSNLFKKYEIDESFDVSELIKTEMAKIEGMLC